MHKVLIVDDDNEILKMMQTALKMKNYEVVVYQEISTPIIFVSAKDTEEDIVTGLSIGGDDYITKPFSLKQLIAKVEANIKREERNKTARQTFSRVRRDLGKVTFYLEERCVCINSQTIPLTSREYDILELLSRRTSKVLTREEIFAEVYDEYAETLFRSISEYIYQIRQKFAPYDIDPIKTIRGLGYKWND